MSDQAADTAETTGHGGFAAAVRTGWVVFVVLAVLTAVEYVIAVELDKNIPILVGIAIIKAALIMNYFMHIARMWLSHGGEA